MNEKFLIEYLSKFNNVVLPSDQDNDAKIRALMNITMPIDLSLEFYTKQDEYLQELLKSKTIVDAESILSGQRVALHLGDITLVKADAIVNACNNTLLGCFVPGHYCIDNAIHSFAGLQVRRDLMNDLQGTLEPNGRCRVTAGYNLLCKYIFHTVGPHIHGEPTPQDILDLQNCYISCLKMADKLHLDNIVFCSISTGLYSFPIKKASEIAYNTVLQYLDNNKTNLKVIFDLFSVEDYLCYERLSKENK